MMRGRQTGSSPLFRTSAAVTLLVWLAAYAFCTGHCTLGIGHGDGELVSCHSTTLSASDHDDSDDPSSPTHHDDSSTTTSCLTLKNAVLGSASPPLVQPEFSLLYTLTPAVLAVETTSIEATAGFTRQSWRRDWVFTPEVCLGPAHRSHAPPFLG